MLSGVVRVGSTLNAAVRGNRPLNLAESSSLFSISFIFGILALLAIFFPKLIAYPIAGVAGWAGLWLLIKAMKLRFAQEARSPRSAVKRRDGR